MKNSLIASGLTEPQADMYLLLLDKGTLAPPAAAKELGLTRSNAYKVLEQLMENGLARREEIRKKFVYSAGDPQALNNILARERNRLLALEKAVQLSQETLRAQYQKRSSELESKTYYGRSKLKKLYEDQARLRQPIYFIKSRQDIPVMGFETMHQVRTLPATYGVSRYGITADTPEAPADDAIDSSAKLTRTWIDEDAYTAPVEWSVSGDEITIFVFEKDGAAVRIKNPAIAESLRQVWQIMDTGIRQDPAYKALPHKAERQI